ncbi:MAG TPA: AAA family ATPase [Archangium sp.]|uniref:AAA family ATPase n=1 Tax=Archangium sp. TaxID=1872627 RepID=UPI002E3067A0|nr:AAA family ATPase [Archangium sp.]HEX5751667.1 AAA family ATPase [Archangium sp.]
MNKLTKLSIKKFRNVAPTTLEFRPGLNVLLGKNAAGKTTLLRLLSTAVGAPEEALRDDVLDLSYRVSSAALEFEHTLVRTRIDEPTLGLEPGRPEREELSSIQQTNSIVIEKDGAVVAKAQVLANEVVLEFAGKQSRIQQRNFVSPISALSLALSRDRNDPASKDLAGKLLSARIQSAGRMDESLDRFNRLLKFELRKERLKDSSRVIFNTGDAPRSMYAIDPNLIPEDMSATFSLEFLERAAHVLGYESASARFDVERLSPDPGRQIARLSNLRFFFRRPGEEVSHDLLSYGQKRLLTFFAHADASRDIIIADELVNGLHHEWISACLTEIGDRQAFLTSQNPLLLDFLRFDSADEVRRTFILCERATGESGPQLIWRNPTEEEAESFFSAYQTGIQRVSDILLTKGLW